MYNFSQVLRGFGDGTSQGVYVGSIIDSVLISVF